MALEAITEYNAHMTKQTQARQAGSTTAEIPAVDPLKTAIELLDREGYSVDIQGARQVYVNRDLRMSQIEWVGFDMDYTLALYNQKALDALSVKHTVHTLIEKHGYPESISTIEPDPDFAIRGLVIDKKLGNVFKMDSHRYVGRVFHGLEPAPPEVKRAYHDDPVKIESGRFVLVDTLFSLPETFLFATLIDRLQADGKRDLDYQKIYDDVRAAIDLAHADGRIKREILADIPKFIGRDPDLAATLHKWRSAGKKLFLLTNSEFYYSNEVMAYILEGQDSSYPSWKHFFDVSITSAMKPSFFRSDEPFMRLDYEGQSLGTESKTFEKHSIYQGGNVADFERMLGIRGSSVLYVGDHIYGDIVRSKRDSSWRTAMIIQEMEAELQKHGLMVDELRRYADLDVRLAHLDSDLNAQKDALEQVDEAYGAKNDQSEETKATVAHVSRELKWSVDRLSKMRKEVVRSLIHLDEEISANFNPYWGLLFKEGAEHSTFGGQMVAHAGLYTSRVSNFRQYSPLQYFRARRQTMPHEI